MKTFRKQPRDHLDYDINLADWLVDGDEIESVDVTADEGLEITSRGISDTGVKIWLRGGTSGETYKVTALIGTESRTKEVEFLIIVVEL